jgi:hypothetical protein
MFKGTKSSGNNPDTGGHYIHTDYPCGCRQSMIGREGWYDPEFKPCNGDIMSPKIDDVFALHFKRAMEDLDLDDKDPDDCETLIKCMKSYEFKTLVDIEVGRDLLRRRLNRMRDQETEDATTKVATKKQKLAAPTPKSCTETPAKKLPGPCSRLIWRFRAIGVNKLKLK